MILNPFVSDMADFVVLAYADYNRDHPIPIMNELINYTQSSTTIKLSYSVAPASYSLLEAILMQDSTLVLNERHTLLNNPSNRTIFQTVTAWLTKELHK